MVVVCLHRIMICDMEEHSVAFPQNDLLVLTKLTQCFTFWKSVKDLEYCFATINFFIILILQ